MRTQEKQPDTEDHTKNHLSVLFIEHDHDDVALAQTQLSESGLTIHAERVEHLSSLEETLADHRPDVIVSNYHMPDFTGDEALALAQQMAPDVPFLFVAGALGEEVAVDLIRKGASNFLLKDHIEALPQQVMTSLKENTTSLQKDNTEDALPASEQYFRSLIEHSSDMILVINQDGVICYASPSSAHIVGFSPDQLHDRTFLEFIDDNDRHDVRSLMTNVVHEQATKKTETSIENRDGRFWDVEVVLTPDTRSSRLITNVRDISERKAVERKLVDSNQMLTNLTNTVPGIVYRFRVTPDGQQHFDFVSGGIYNLLGYEPDEFKMNFIKVWENILQDDNNGLKDDYQDLMNSIYKSIQNLEPWEKEFRAITKNGTLKWIHGASIPETPQADGTVVFNGIMSDVTERRAAQLELENHRNMLQNMTNTVPGVIYRERLHRNGERVFEFVSDGTYELLGVSVDEFKDKSNGPWNHLLAEDYEYFVSQVTDAIQNKKTFDGEFRFSTTNGDIKWIHLKAVPEFPEDDDTLVYNGIMSDVTERRVAEKEVSKLNIELEQRVQQRTDELERANKELATFNYTVSHDLQNPIRTVEVFAKYLQKNFGNDINEEAQHYIDRINSSVEEMKQLINDLLQLSKMGRNELAKESVNMRDFMEGVYNELKQHFPNRNIQWHNGEMPWAKVDKAICKHVLVNLINNAVKYTEGKEPAVIETGGYYENGKTVYYVKDNGAGFASSKNNQVFQAFQRMHSSKEFKGTGIGLAIVEKAVERHGGTVWANGEEGKGAIFYFSLPAE